MGVETRGGVNKCRNLVELAQGKDERHQPGQPGEPVGRGVVRGPGCLGKGKEARHPSSRIQMGQ